MKKLMILSLLLFSACVDFNPAQPKEKVEPVEQPKPVAPEARLTEEVLYKSGGGTTISVLTVDGREYLMVRIYGEGVSVCPKLK
jgi:hypothetical protein